MYSSRYLADTDITDTDADTNMADTNMADTNILFADNDITDIQSSQYRYWYRYDQYRYWYWPNI